MNLFQLLEAFLYHLSVLFFYPVIMVLFLLLGGMFYSLGIFCREGLLRLRKVTPVIEPFAAEMEALPATNAGQMELLLAAILQEAEQEGRRPIQWARYSIKMGPTLGLIGTLTPMAKALSSLSQGNLAALSSQMVTAFSTTVLGLIIGAVAFTIVHVRVKWQRKDLSVLSKLAEEKLLAMPD